MKLLVDLGVVFLVLCAGAAFLVGVAHHAFAPFIDGLRAKWRARLRFAALIAPISVGFLSVIIALIPSFLHVIGLAEDHCLNSLEHNHAHLCFVHRPTGVSLLLASIVAGVATTIFLRSALVVARWWRAHRVFATVIATSSIRTLRTGEYLFDSEVPVCVTTGLLRPKIFISTAAAAALGRDCVQAALAHERGHVARQETRARFLGAMVEAFHVPGFGRSILQRWQEDSEFLCDQFAARSAGSPTLVAEALVRFQRAMLEARATPLCASACLCASASALDARVTTLLAAESTDDSEGTRLAYVLGFALLLLEVGLQARHLHHSLESFVGFLASVFI